MAEDAFIITLREYIDFLNNQIGMYVDVCSGFGNNKRIIERQVARVSRASGSRIDENGQKVIMRVSYEDPSQPDVIHQRIVRATNYIAENAEGGSHEQQHTRAIIVFIYAFWDEEIRHRLAMAKNIQKDAIMSDIMGDLRYIRRAILHDKAILQEAHQRKLKKVGGMFAGGKPIIISQENMHKIVVLIKQDIMRMINEHTGPVNGAPNPEDIRDVAIQL